VFLFVFIFLTRLNRELLGVSEVGVLVHNVVEVGDLQLRDALLLVGMTSIRSHHLRLASKRTTFFTVSWSVLPKSTWEWF